MKRGEIEDRVAKAIYREMFPSQVLADGETAEERRAQAIAVARAAVVEMGALMLEGATR